MILLKGKEEVEIMAEAGRRLAGILAVLREKVVPGITTDSLDQLAKNLIEETGSRPAFLGYHPYGARTPYPKTMCVSVNDVVVHGVPSDYVIQEGDLVKLDLGLVHKKFYADAAITIGVGKIASLAERLIQTTRDALERGIYEMRAGNTIGDIGAAIGKVITSNGFSVVEGLTGHGIGRDLHEDPFVPNFGERGTGLKLESGMVLALEPMVAIGRGKIRQTKDDAYATFDGSLAAHFEHTVAITENGPLVLTQCEK